MSHGKTRDRTVAPVKTQLVDKQPKKFKGIKFGIQSNQHIISQGVLEVSDRLLYDIDNSRVPYRHGPLDPRLGTSSKTGTCETCHQSLQLCTGHFGYVRLSLPVFHIGYLKFTMKILQEICKSCGRVLLNPQEKQAFLRELRRPGIDNQRRAQIKKRINDTCRKVKECPYCQSINGQIRKIGVIKLCHDKFVAFNKSTSARKMPPLSKVIFDASFTEAKKHNSDLEKHLRKAMEDLNPLTVLNLFRKISSEDCEILGIDPYEGRPEMFLWQFLPAPPICIRPSVAQEGASTEDDITTKLAEIVHISGLIRAALEKGSPLQTVMELWEYLQLQVAMYVNSDIPGLQQPGFGKTARGFCQRLKGKQGRFRGNLSGKRVDFSGRTVISPDPNLAIDEVAVPIHVAKNLTYPERVNLVNYDKMHRLVANGPENWPGAQTIIKKDDGGYKINLKYGDRNKHAESLKVGDIVERHLEDNDIVLFNRQPSLHKLSIMCHRVKVRPWRTFRLNECVCTPYNADFDGDEMNLHVPQTEEARAEAMNLMGVKYNLATPKNGEPIIAATQDFITAAFLLSGKDRFYDLKTFTYLVQQMMDGTEHLDLPMPAILRPRLLWTGKQIFSMLLRPNKKSNVLVNLDAKCRGFKGHPKYGPYMCPNDGYLVIRNSEVLAGVMDKSTVGSGKKDSVFYVILRDFGPDDTIVAMNRLAKLCSRGLTNMGFSIGIGDVFPLPSLTQHKEKLVKDAYVECDGYITQFNTGKLEKAPGCNMEMTLENKMSGILSRVREDAGQYCIATLSRHNAPLIMAKSGSKGSNINVAQMVAVVGQQIIGGARVADGFQDRTLPHFFKNARQPPSKGFVKNSFYTGLVPTEFLFHAISGREGLVDTAVKTAETGYMSRRLMKSLEDLSTQYDDTVRTSGGGIVQFQFGADKLDPVNMEGSAVPVNFPRSWTHAENFTWNNDESGLESDEIDNLCASMLDAERERYKRKDLFGEDLAFNDDSDRGVDGHEGARKFLDTIQAFIKSMSDRQRKARATIFKGQKPNPRQTDYEVNTRYVDQIAKVSKTALEKFIHLCLEKYSKAHVEPGHAVGAVGAQSIGEPGTQMTLKTFHFAGVAGMNLTQGVPRIKEIINASKLISTPIITCPLENSRSIEAARDVKGRIEKTFVEDVIQHVETVWDASEGNIQLRLDEEALSSLHLGIGAHDIASAIYRQKKLKIQPSDISCHGNSVEVKVRVPEPDGRKGQRSRAEDCSDLLLRASHLKRVLPSVPISGYAEASRAIIQTSDKGGTNTVLVEGYGLRQCMNTVGVIGTGCWTNSVMETKDVLGIEAARSTIATEIGAVMKDMNIDPRHMQLLADVMTCKGEVLGITRFGLSKMRDSVLQLASFEKTPDHLFEAAAGMKTDRIEGVSESIIMGQTMKVGTGAFNVVRRLGIRDFELEEEKTVFEDAWREAEKEKRKNRMAGGTLG